jgi:hypothetical protein
MSKNRRKSLFWGLPGTDYTRISILVHKKFRWSGFLERRERPGNSSGGAGGSKTWQAGPKETRKTALTAQLLAETAVALEWIAERLDREAHG